MSHHEYEDVATSKALNPQDLGVGILHTITDGPSKWDLLVAFGDSRSKNATVEFAFVKKTEFSGLRHRFRVVLMELRHGARDHCWEFVGVANLYGSTFRCRGSFNSRTREGHFSRITT